MKCPACGSTKSDHVVDSQTRKDGTAVRRRRECLACFKRWTTYEVEVGGRRLSLLGARVIVTTKRISTPWSVKADGRVLIRGYRETNALACLGWVRKTGPRGEWLASRVKGGLVGVAITKSRAAACRHLWRLRHPTTASRMNAGG